MIDSAPEVHHVPIHPDMNFIEMPVPAPVAAHPRDAQPPDVGCKDRAEPVPQLSDGLVAKSMPRSKSRSSTFRK